MLQKHTQKEHFIHSLVKNSNAMSFKKRKFSLVELLVIISTLLILASLLQPSLKNMLAQAEAIKCLSNLRHITIGAFGFESDNDNQMPLASRSYASGGSWSGPHIFSNATAIYLGLEPLNGKVNGYHPSLNADVFKCPSQFDINQQNVTYAESQKLSKINFIDARLPRRESAKLYLPANKNLVLGLNAVNGVVSANKIPYFYDGVYRFNSHFYRWTSSWNGDGTDPNTANGNPNTLIHNDGRSVSFLDGHAEIKNRYDSIWDPSKVLRVSNRILFW